MGNPDLLASPKAAEEKPTFTRLAVNTFMGEYGPTQSLTHPCARGYDLSTSDLLFSLCSQRPDSHPSFDSEPVMSFHLGVGDRVGHKVCMQHVYLGFGNVCTWERVGPLLLWLSCLGYSLIHCLCQLSLCNK